MTEQRTPERILAAATELFAQRGYSGASVKELAEAAGVNIALISYHFGGKEKLYEAVLESQFAQINEIIERIDQVELSAVERIRRIGQISLLLHEKCPHFNRLMLSENVNPNRFYEARMQEHARDFRKRIQQIIDAGIEAAELRDDFDPQVAALGLVSMVQFYFSDRDFSGLFLDRKIEQDVDQAAYYITHAVELFLRSVVKA